MRIVVAPALCLALFRSLHSPVQVGQVRRLFSALQRYLSYLLSAEPSLSGSALDLLLYFFLYLLTSVDKNKASVIGHLVHVPLLGSGYSELFWSKVKVVVFTLQQKLVGHKTIFWRIGWDLCQLKMTNFLSKPAIGNHCEVGVWRKQPQDFQIILSCFQAKRRLNCEHVCAPFQENKANDVSLWLFPLEK